MMTLALALLAAVTLNRPQVQDSTAGWITVTPQESLRVTAVGPVDGPAVVIIPGLVSPAYAYRKVLPPLADSGVRAVVIEPLGVGQSSRPGDADYSHTAQAARIAAVMDTLGITHAVVMGHVVGAAIALRMTLARPDLVNALLLVEGGAIESAAVPGVKKALKFAWLIKLFVGRGRIKKELRKGLIASSADTSWVSDSVIDHYTEGEAGNMGAVLRGLKGMQRAVEPDSLTPRLDRIHVPVVLLAGAAPHDAGIGRGRILALQHGLPHFSIDSVPGAGLQINEERPAAVVGALMNLVHQDEL
ncbi:MAG TPA: alpha/beta hydrolase, partial [Gemmatimonadales bacterium]|nr:alpha/beta hydrolase [Gemmatimonadales bacterium]